MLIYKAKQFMLIKKIKKIAFLEDGASSVQVDIFLDM
jgi:hypothetical protein